ncbi:MAG TPA: sulfur carrier protein ThiS [Polyangia bacterium]|nr:sulfur carrier protein ThiS [Polyangia bacterium]
MEDISVTVNGETRTLPRNCTVSQLLQLLGLDPRRVAVERNLDVIPRRTYGDAQLAAGDSVEIVTFVGGG